MNDQKIEAENVISNADSPQGHQADNPEMVISRKKNLLLNRGTLLVAILAFISAVYNLVMGFDLLMAAYLDLVGGSIFLACYILNRLKKTHLAAVIFLASLNLMFLLFCYSYPIGTGLYLLFLVSMVLAPILLGSKEKKTAVVFILLSVVSIVLVFNVPVSFIPVTPLTPQLTQHSLAINLSVTVTIISFSLYWLIRLTSQTEQWLNEMVHRSLNKSQELEKANKELDKFIYRVSHDLRSPISSVKGLATIATHEVNDPNAQYFLKEIIASIERLDSFAKEVIEYSKNTLTDVVIEPVSLKQLITEAIDNLKYMNGAASIQFRCNIDLDLDTILVDRKRMKIVLYNFVANAIKYHDSKKDIQYIEVSAKKIDGDLVVSVADNGMGIATQYCSKIFEMFYRATSTSTGSGLGLYIVKEAVEKMNGTISVESVQGKGSTFTVRISGQKSTIHKVKRAKLNETVLVNI